MPQVVAPGMFSYEQAYGSDHLQLVEALPNHYTVPKAPRKPTLPSIDGSRLEDHLSRLDALCANMARELQVCTIRVYKEDLLLQTVRCGKCRQSVQLSDTANHSKFCKPKERRRKSQPAKMPHSSNFMPFY